MAKENRFQPNRAGHHTPVAVHPGMVVSHQSHGDAAKIGGDGGRYSGRDGKAKHVQAVPVHPASHRVTGTNIGAPVATTLSSIPDASNPNAMDPTKPGKSFIGKPVPSVPGQRSRITDAPGPGTVQGGVSANHEAGKGGYALHCDLGRRIIGEALDCAESDHPAKLGRR